MNDLEDIQKPLSPLEMSELLEACKGCLNTQGVMLLRRLMFEVDLSRNKKCPHQLAKEFGESTESS